MSDSSVSTKELLDEDDHLLLLDGAGAVLVEGGEDLVEGLRRELVTRAEVAKGILNELLGFILVEGTRVVDVVGGPDLVDDTCDSLFFSGHSFILFVTYYNIFAPLNLSHESQIV